MTSFSFSSFVITFYLYSRLYTSLFDDDKTAEQDSRKEKKKGSVWRDDTGYFYFLFPEKLQRLTTSTASKQSSAECGNEHWQKHVKICLWSIHQTTGVDQTHFYGVTLRL